MTVPTTPTSATPPATTGKPAGPERNVIGLIALITAVLGFIFACMPGALIVGWVLLPIAFILALVALFQRGRKRGAGIAALIVSVVGTVVGFIVFLAVVADAFEESFGSDLEATAPSDSSSAEPGESSGDEGDDAAAEDSEGDAAAEDPAAEEPAGDGEQGTRDNPYPLGTEVSAGDWSITVNSVDLDATPAITGENTFNEAPEDGNTYILVNITALYTGSDAAGATPWVDVEYVSAGGNTFSSFDAMVVAPDSFDSGSTLYEGASESGNIAIEVPAEDVEAGALSITPDMFGESVFVSVA